VAPTGTTTPSRWESAKGAAGETLAALAGQTLHYLQNDQSAALAKGEAFQSQRVLVKGKIFGPERTLEVRSLAAP
jgi:hypothetical protein